MNEIFSFDPVYAPDARILILGTMPSVKSLEMGFYYAHPQNAFWRIIADVFECDKPETISDKKTLLIGNRIALWDTAKSCVRNGSLDSEIKSATPNDVAGILSRCPGITRVLLNGQKAGELFKRFFKDTIAVRSIVMPSTSPAYTIRYEKKLDAWRKAITLEEYNERRSTN